MNSAHTLAQLIAGGMQYSRTLSDSHRRQLSQLESQIYLFIAEQIVRQLPFDVTELRGEIDGADYATVRLDGPNLMESVYLLRLRFSGLNEVRFLTCEIRAEAGGLDWRIPESLGLLTEQELDPVGKLKEMIPRLERLPNGIARDFACPWCGASVELSGPWGFSHGPTGRVAECLGEHKCFSEPGLR
jgi:hypothetical protein